MQRFTDPRVALRVMFALVLMAMLASGLVFFFHGSDKVQLTNGIGVSEYWRAANGLAQMVFGGLLIQFAFLGAIMDELARQRRHQHEHETRGRA